jgi:NADPH:quinone reductase
MHGIQVSRFGGPEVLERRELPVPEPGAGVVDAAAVHPLPPRLSYGQGAAVGVPCVTAWRALFQKARLQPGETVLLHGASGGVGVSATQLAVDAGAVVVGTAGSAAGGRRSRTAGSSSHGLAGS